MIKKICLFFNKRVNRGICVYGNCFKAINKKNHIKINSFDFNVDWNQKHIHERRSFGRLEINEGVSFVVTGKSIMRSGCTLVCFKNSKLTIGDKVNFNNGCEVYCSDHIVIGDDTIFGNGCIIRDSDIHTIDGKVNHKPIHIGNHVWVGTNCIILKGVTIGDGSIIGAGSVVTKDIPSRCIAAGNPAVVIKKDVDWIR